MDLSRVVALYPFFCAGYYAGRHDASGRIDQLSPQSLRRLRLGCTAAVCALMAIHFVHGSCPAPVLYRNEAFGSGWDFVARIIVQLVAAAWCAWLMVVVPNRDLSPVTVVGRNTMSVYLLHPWLIRAFRYVLPLPGGEPVQIAICVLVDLCMLAALGNDAVGQRFAYVFGGGWLKRR